MKRILITSMALCCLFFARGTTGDTGFTQLFDTYWRLVELNGKEVKPSANEKEEIHIILKKEGNMLEGFAGCNSIGGSYEVKDNHLTFANVIGTMVSCPETEIENLFLEILKSTETYSVSGNMLTLGNKEISASAKFMKKK